MSKESRNQIGRYQWNMKIKIDNFSASNIDKLLFMSIILIEICIYHYHMNSSTPSL